MQTDHEDSRAAFEADHHPSLCVRNSKRDYHSPLMNAKWAEWCRALDWRDSQVCGWKHDPDYWAWETACGETYCFENEGPKENNVRFCHGCGRRVKIQQPTTKDHETKNRN